MAAEMRTLLWLQLKLTLAMFRARRASVWASAGRIVLALMLLVMGLPFFGLLAVGLGWAMARMSAPAAVELAMLANTLLLFVWLVTPGTYSSELIERIELSRLFVYPISRRGLVGGGLVLSLFSPPGLWSALVLAGEIVGLAWHGLWALPFVLLGSVTAFGILLLAGRVIQDVFDLAAGDRRLRGLLLFLMALPFIALFVGYYYLEFTAMRSGSMDRFLEPIIGPTLAFRGMSVFQVLDQVLLRWQLSRYLLFLPPGWAVAAMGFPVAGRLAAGLGFLALASLFTAGLVWAHAAILQHLIEGEALHLGSERVRSGRLAPELPGPPALWALLAKDWTYLRRSPMTRQVLIGSPVVAVIFGLTLWGTAPQLPESSAVRLALPYIAAAIVPVAVNLGMLNFNANYYGAIDREGFAGLMLAPVERYFVLLSSAVMTLLFTLAQSLALLLVLAVLMRNPLVLPWGLYLTLCLHVATAPAYNLVSIYSPYRAQLTFSMNNKGQGSLWMVLAWVLASAPVLALFVVPLLFWRGGLAVTLPLAAIYAGVAFVVTLQPLARLLDRRTYQVLEVVSRVD